MTTQNESPRSTEASVVADIAARNVLLGSQPKPIQHTHIDGDPFVVLVDATGAQRVQPLGQFQPPRKRAQVAVSEPQSFVEYWNTYADDHSRVFCDVDDRRFCAILDYHDPKSGDALGRRGEHRVTFELEYTPTMEAWLRLAKEPVQQAVLAEFLEDRYRDILEPEGAAVLELAKTLEVKNNVAFKSVQRKSDGGYDLNYEEQVTTRAGQQGSIEVPSRFLLRVPVFEGGKPVDLPMRLRFRLQGSAVFFAVSFIGLEDIIRGVVTQVRDEIATGIERPVWAGSASIG